MELYPPDSELPKSYSTDEYVIRGLGPQDNALDYEAVMASVAYYRQFAPSDWSTDHHSLEENGVELTHHQEDHIARTAFTFTIQSRTDEQGLGCIYVNSYQGLLRWLKRPQEEITAVSKHEAQLYFWTRPSCFDSDLDRRILEGMMNWFHQEWSFTKLIVQTYEQDQRQSKILRESELHELGKYPLPKGDGQLLLFARS